MGNISEMTGHYLILPDPIEFSMELCSEAIYSNVLHSCTAQITLFDKKDESYTHGVTKEDTSVILERNVLSEQQTQNASSITANSTMADISPITAFRISCFVCICKLILRTCETTRAQMRLLLHHARQAHTPRYTSFANSLKWACP